MRSGKPKTVFEKATKPELFCAEENGQGVFKTEKEVLKLCKELPRMRNPGGFFHSKLRSFDIYWHKFAKGKNKCRESVW